MPTAALSRNRHIARVLADPIDDSLTKGYNSEIWTSFRTTGDWLRVSTVNMDLSIRRLFLGK